MMEKLQEILKDFLNEYPGLVGVISGVLLALSPSVGQAVINRITGKSHQEAETTAATVAKLMVGATKEFTDLANQVLNDTIKSYKAKLKDADLKYKLLQATHLKEIKTLEKQFETVRKDDKKDFEKAQAILRTALTKVELQNAKLKEQLEFVRNEGAQSRFEADAWRNQIIDDFKGVPKRVPMFDVDSKDRP